MKKIDAIAAEIRGATQSANGLDQLGRKLAAQHREFVAHIQNGMSYEDVGLSYIEEQIRLYLVYTLDRPMWEQLVARTEQFALQDRNAMSPMFSPWGYLHSDLVENIGEGLGWIPGGSSKNLGATTFVQRLGMIVSAFEALTPTQVKQIEASLELEEGVAPPRSGGCYIATAVYGSYDCPEVWVLRRWRDTYLASSTIGRRFIRLYYSVSPGVVRTVGHHPWFTGIVRRPLNRFVDRLRASGYSSLPYSDRP